MKWKPISVVNGAAIDDNMAYLIRGQFGSRLKNGKLILGKKDILFFEGVASVQSNYYDYEGPARELASAIRAFDKIVVLEEA